MKLNPQELQQSRLSDRKAPGYIETSLAQMIAIARVRVDGNAGQNWRITLGRIDRVDDTAVGHPGDPGGSFSLYPGQNYQYDYWQLSNPIFPPRRASPIFDADTPAQLLSVGDAMVEIAWGVGDGQRANRLLAQWPWQGASIVVCGTYAEVWAGQLIGQLGSPPAPPGSLPIFQAGIVQENGQAAPDSSELSLMVSQVINNQLVEQFATCSGWTVAGIAGRSLRGSAVKDVGPFECFSAFFTTQVLGATPTITAWTTNAGPPGVVVTDNRRVDAAGVLTFSSGDVAIQISTGGAGVTFNQIALAMNASNILNQVGVTANPGFIVASSPNAWATFGGFVGLNEVLASAVLPAVTDGAVVYVPDFARRLRVDVTHTPIGEGMVPFTGDPKVRIAFWDERGFVITSHYQGVILVAGAVVAISPPQWHPIPDNAVLVGVYTDPADQPLSLAARFHFRVSP